MPRINPLVLTFALVWIITKVVFYYLGDSDTGFTVGIFTNLLFILSICAWTLWRHYRTHKLADTNLLDDLRNAVKQGAVYVLIVVGFTAVYHTVLDPDLIERRIQTRLALHNEHIDSYASFEEFVADQEGIDRSLDREALMGQMEDNARSELHIFRTIGFSLFALMVWVVISAICAAALMRGVIFH